jgi:uncharacterized glyoxalase superfamily protein PhnB
MPATVMPMIHVPDVRTTAHWYASIGFTIRAVNEELGVINWAALVLGQSEIMLDSGGQASSADRREVDLYVTVDDVDEAFARITPHAELVEGLHDTEYGMREFIVRDCNRFWLTFGQPIARR